MVGITTTMADSFKTELFSAGHCFNAPIVPTGDVVSASFSVSGVSSLTGLSVGMAVSGIGIPAGTVIASLSGTVIVLSKAATVTTAGTPVSGTADVFNMALFKASPLSFTYDNTTTNYSVMTGHSDEVASGGGYTTTGTALTNVSPVQGTPTTTSFVNFSPNPSWTSATFITSGCMIYNTSARLGTTGRSCGVFDFGGNQSVSSGTLTVLMPSAAAATAILRLQ